MGKLRHIALSVKDVPAAKKFFEQAFDMETVGESKTGTAYLSDGTINIALLGREGRPLGYEGEEPFYGIDHFGIWVDDVEEACEKLEAAGATHVLGNKSGDPNSFYEVKYRDPQGQLFDITANGWRGAVKDVVPAEEAAKKPAKVG
ncbi:MAG: VOC family protein [Alphaproteobacteria bacterium]